MSAELQALLAAVAAGVPADVCAAGDRVLASPELWAPRVQGRAHPLGFVHMALGEIPQGSVRLHVWPIPAIAPQEPDWPVHRHACSVRSYVLRGAVLNSEYEIASTTSGPHRLYEVSYRDGASVLSATSARISCQLGLRDRYVFGSTYEVEPDAFHSTVSASPEGPAVTVVLMGPHGDRPGTVVGEAEGAARYSYDRLELAAHDVEQMIAAAR